MDAQPIRQWFDRLVSWRDLEDLVSNAQEEDATFEATLVDKPQLTKELKIKLGKCLSGFANANGGILLIGGETRTSKASSRDILIDLQPVGSIVKLATTIETTLSRLSTPDLPGCQVKAIRKPKGNSGCILVFVPRTAGDPIQSHDDVFYWRTSNGFSNLPYSMIRRMFAATDVPDLRPSFETKLVEIDDKGAWHFPLLLENYSSAAAEHSLAYLEILNEDNCQSIKVDGLVDVRKLNPGKCLFAGRWDGVIHRGAGAYMGALKITMASPKGRPRRVLDVAIKCFANNMRAMKYVYKVKLEKSGLKVAEVSSEPL